MVNAQHRVQSGPKLETDADRKGIKQVESTVELYRQCLAPLFPFVVLPEVPAEYLSRSNPLLAMAINMASAFQDRALQAELGSELTEHLCKKICAEGEVSLDALQALLVHMAWYQGHLMRRRIIMLMSMAYALLADLGLNKPSHSNDRRKLIFDNARTSYGFTEQDHTAGRSLDEQRALLGYFYLSSILSVTLNRTDPIKYSLYIQYVCQNVAAVGGPLNLYAVKLVQTQAVMEQISSTLPLDELDLHMNIATGAPIAMHVESLRIAVAALDTDLPSGLENQSTNALLHKHTAAIYVHEVCLYDRAWDATPSSRQHRISTAASCLQACTAFFETFLVVRIELLRTLPYPLWSQLAYALLIVSRLCLMKCPGWDQHEVRASLNFPTLLEKTRGRLLLISELAKKNALVHPGMLSRCGKSENLTPKGDTLFEITAGKVNRIRVWYEDYTQRMSLAESSVQNQQAVDGDGDELADLEIPMLDDRAISGGLDNPFWQEFMQTIDFS